MSLKFLISGCLFLSSISCIASDHAAPPGFLEGNLKIISLKEVDLAGGTPSKAAAKNYSEYPLTIRKQEGNNEVARITARADGNYRVPLSPGNYVLDVEERASKHVRGEAQPFTVVSGQTVRVDMNIDTGIR